jgi:hypothetical protein
MADETRLIQIAYGTASQWENEVRPRAVGEFGYNTDTKEIKIGDGNTAFMELKPLLSGDNAIEQLQAILNTANGIAGLDGNGRVSEANLPVKFFIGEYYHQLIFRPGFVWANGQVLADVSENYPLLKAWLKDMGPYGGAAFRKTLTEWNAEWNDPKWNAPDTSGARAGMSPFYVLDESADTIKVPDLRGAYQAAAGFNGQTSGMTLADAIRAIKTANAGFTAQYSKSFSDSAGAPFANGKQWSTIMWATQTADGNWGTGYVSFDSSSVVPTDTVNHPRSIADYLCLYAGAAA